MNNPRELLIPLQSRLFTCISVIFVLVAVSGTLHAAVLEEVVVTAQKREQRLQDVGISVTVFSGDQLKEFGFINSIDLVAQTPGLEVSGAGGGSTNQFSIRGVTQNDFAASQESPVAVYVDEGYISLNAVTGFSVFDIDRVEVLRGPQGTLFGRNATGGLVHYITAKPSQDSEGFVDVQLGEEGRRRVEGAVSGGLTEGISGRLSGVYNKNDGLLDNDIGPDLMEADDYSIRGQLLIETDEDWNILLKAQYSDEDSVRGGYSHTLGVAGEFVTDPTATDFFGYRDADGSPYTQSNDFPGSKTAEIVDLSAHINWNIGRFTVTSVTNYQDIEQSYDEDADASPIDIYNYQATDFVEQVSQEFRLSWEGERYRALMGVYFLNIDGEYNARQTGDAFFGTGVGYPAGTAELAGAIQDTTTYALFGQAEIDITDTLALTLGVRYNNDDKDFTYNSTDIYFLQGGSVTFTDSLSEDDVSAKAQLDFRPNDNWLLYFGVSRGIKAGGFNFPLFPIVAEDYHFSGEVLMSYEGGFKANLNETTRLNASVYYYDYDDYQAYSFDGFATFLFNANAENYGAEIEFITSPAQGLEILLGVSFLDSEVTDVPLSISATGKETAALAPDVTVNGLARYEWPAFNGSLALQTDFTWRDDHNFNLSYTPVIEEKDYGLINARLSYTSGSGSWSAAVFGKNLGDTRYRRYAFDTTAFFGSIEDVVGDERWVGGSISYRW